MNQMGSPSKADQEQQKSIEDNKKAIEDAAKAG